MFKDSKPIEELYSKLVYLCQEPVWVSAVAGHSMTLTSEDKLVIIGGFSTNDYFSDSVYVCDTNSYPTYWERHNADNITQAKPTG